MIVWRIPRLRPGDIEPHHSLSAETNGRSRSIHRVGAVSETRDDQVHREVRVAPGPGQPSKGRLDDVEPIEAAHGAQAGVEANLRIDHPIGGQVRRGLVGDAFDRLCGLHHRHRVDKGFEVPLEGTGTALVEPSTQGVDIGCGEYVATPIREFQHRFRPQTPVEMVVEHHQRSAGRRCRRHRGALVQ